MVEDIVHITSEMLPFKIALIGLLGISAQWLAWRLQRPAIVLMAIAGLLFGPFVGWLMGQTSLAFIHTLLSYIHLNPRSDFAELYRPMIGLAVAIILFEGGLNLRFKDLGDASHAIGRMVFVAAPVAWFLGACAAHYGLGLAWDLSAMIGGLFVVTGPTVIMPLLRQAHLKSRPANVLKWEGIVNDPLGALLAVGCYEFIRFNMGGANINFVFINLTLAALLGAVVGIFSGFGLTWAFRRGYIPEYLKAPMVLVWVLIIYVIANMIADETGLLAVTAMGMAMANVKFASIEEMRRFKETIATILVSGIFVILTATLTPDILINFISDFRIIAFVLIMMVIVRPISVMLSTRFAGLSWQESLLISLIAPRGIVAVAVAGLFTAELQALGRMDAEIFIPLTFALVFATVIFAGFAITPLARWLGLSTAEQVGGILIVGANPWSLGLAKALKEMGIGVLVADTNWRRLKGARLDGHATFYGEVLSENADYRLDHSVFDYLIAASPNDAYNALACVEFAPELGRHRVFQVAGQELEDADSGSIAFTSRGRILLSKGRTFDGLTSDWWKGWRFRITTLSESYKLDNLLQEREGLVDIILAQKPDGGLEFHQIEQHSRIEGVKILSFSPPKPADLSDQAAEVLLEPSG